MSPLSFLLLAAGCCTQAVMIATKVFAANDVCDWSFLWVAWLDQEHALPREATIPGCQVTSFLSFREGRQQLLQVILCLDLSHSVDHVANNEPADLAYVPLCWMEMCSVCACEPSPAQNACNQLESSPFAMSGRRRYRRHHVSNA